MVRLTVVRSPWVADHGKGWADAHPDFAYTDQGVRQFSLRLHPYLGRWQDAGLPRKALEHATRWPRLMDTYHEGSLPQTQSFATLTGNNLIVGAIKRAENEQGLIVRVWESAGRDTAGTLSGPLFGGRTIEWRWRPFELCTLWIPDDPDQSVKAVDIPELSI
jgi:alpha-mannosidase